MPTGCYFSWFRITLKSILCFLDEVASRFVLLAAAIHTDKIEPVAGTFSILVIISTFLKVKTRWTNVVASCLIDTMSLLVGPTFLTGCLLSSPPEKCRQTWMMGVFMSVYSPQASLLLFWSCYYSIYKYNQVPMAHFQSSTNGTFSFSLLLFVYKKSVIAGPIIIVGMEWRCHIQIFRFY